MASFQQLLIVFSALIFAVTLLLLFISQKGFPKTKRRLPSLSTPKLLKVLQGAHYSLIVLFLAMIAYSIWFGSRPTIYYGIFGLLLLTSTLFVVAKQPKRRYQITLVVLATVLLLSFVQSLLPVFENRFVPFGSDQWGYLVDQKHIANQGSFAGAAYLGGYYSIPLLSIFNAAVSLITGSVSTASGGIFLSSAIILCVMNLAVTLMIYLSLLKLTKNEIASLVGVFVFFSTPRLALVQEIPSILSFVLASCLILLLIRYLSAPSRRLLVTLLLVAFSALIFHTVGIVIFVALCGVLILVNFTSLGKLIYGNSKMIGNLLGIVIILSLAYWSLNLAIFSSILSPIRTLLSSIVSSLGPSIYVPNYYASGLETFAFAFALSVGISAAYVAATLFKFIRNRKSGRFANIGTLGILPLAAGVVGLLLLLIAFFSATNAPGGSVERYLSVPAYFLLIFSSAIVGFKIINSKQVIACVCIILLLVVGVYIGSSSPDWSPFENPAFGAIHYGYTGYVEANTVANFLANNSKIFTDYDIVVDGVAGLTGLSYTTSGTFQIIRNAINSIKDGTFVPSSSSLDVNATYTIKLNEVQNTTAIYKYTNILYSSGMHLTLRIP